jgi:hypothetical protein
MSETRKIAAILVADVVGYSRRASTNGYATDDRIVRPGRGVSHDADPADAADEPQEGR